jgi:hypothetical protein
MTTAQRILQDPFCEVEFWNFGPHVWPQQPLSTVTALLMVLMGLKRNRCDATNSDAGNNMFLMCKTALVVVGCGTIVYHGFDPSTMADKHLNHAMCDWLPIVVMCACILFLYASKLAAAGARTACFIAIMLWLFVLVFGMDSDTAEHMQQTLGSSGGQGTYGSIVNGILLGPLALVLLSATLYHFEWRHAKYLFYSIGISLLMWLINAYYCRQYLWLSALHALYHLTIAYAFVYAACLGACLPPSAYQFELTRWGWPTLTAACDADYTYLDILYETSV